MGTPAGAPTTGLLQATQYLKDNRLLPRGFDKQTAAAEIAVFGGAAADPDFTGEADRVRYRVVAAGAASVQVELRYQPIGYRWAQNLAPVTRPPNHRSSSSTTMPSRPLRPWSWRGRRVSLRP